MIREFQEQRVRRDRGFFIDQGGTGGRVHHGLVIIPRSFIAHIGMRKRHEHDARRPGLERSRGDFDRVPDLKSHRGENHRVIAGRFAGDADDLDNLIRREAVKFAGPGRGKKRPDPRRRHPLRMDGLEVFVETSRRIVSGQRHQMHGAKRSPVERTAHFKMLPESNHRRFSLPCSPENSRGQARRRAKTMRGEKDQPQQAMQVLSLAARAAWTRICFISSSEGSWRISSPARRRASVTVSKTSGSVSLARISRGSHQSIYRSSCSYSLCFLVSYHAVDTEVSSMFAGKTRQETEFQRRFFQTSKLVDAAILRMRKCAERSHLSVFYTAGMRSICGDSERPARIALSL